MHREIKLLKNNDKLELSDLEWTKMVFDFLQEKIKLSRNKAFSVVYYLQEHFPVIPDHIEKCDTCGELYDTHSSGHHSDLTGKFYCCESCEPRGLYEREQRWEKRQDAPFQKWLKQVKKEQKHYPALKGKEISEFALRGYFSKGKSPIDTLNDILTLV
jgi:hypothetical protein